MTPADLNRRWSRTVSGAIHGIRLIIPCRNSKPCPRVESPWCTGSKLAFWGRLHREAFHRADGSRTVHTPVSQARRPLRYAKVPVGGVGRFRPLLGSSSPVPEARPRRLAAPRFGY